MILCVLCVVRAVRGDLFQQKWVLHIFASSTRRCLIQKTTLKREGVSLDALNAELKRVVWHLQGVAQGQTGQRGIETYSNFSIELKSPTHHHTNFFPLGGGFKSFSESFTPRVFPQIIPMSQAYFIIWVFPKIVVPPNDPLKNRVFHYFHHSFWGVLPLFFGFPPIYPNSTSKHPKPQEVVTRWS